MSTGNPMSVDQSTASTEDRADRTVRLRIAGTLHGLDPHDTKGQIKRYNYRSLIPVSWSDTAVEIEVVVLPRPYRDNLIWQTLVDLCGESFASHLYRLGDDHPRTIVISDARKGRLLNKIEEDLQRIAAESLRSTSSR